MARSPLDDSHLALENTRPEPLASRGRETKSKCSFFHRGGEKWIVILFSSVYLVHAHSHSDVIEDRTFVWRRSQWNSIFGTSTYHRVTVFSPLVSLTFSSREPRIRSLGELDLTFFQLCPREKIPKNILVIFFFFLSINPFRRCISKNDENYFQSTRLSESSFFSFKINNNRGTVAIARIQVFTIEIIASFYICAIEEKIQFS